MAELEYIPDYRLEKDLMPALIATQSGTVRQNSAALKETLTEAVSAGYIHPVGKRLTSKGRKLLRQYIYATETEPRKAIREVSTYAVYPPKPTYYPRSTP